MFDAISALRDRVQSVLNDYTVYVVQEGKSVSVTGKTAIIWGADSNVRVIGIGAAVADDTATVEIDLYVPVGSEGVISCYETLAEDVVKLQKSLMNDILLDKYMITFVNSARDTTSRVVGFCSSRVTVNMVRFLFR